MNPSITIATCSALPDGAPDDSLLVSVLRDRGFNVRFAVWNEEHVDWSQSDLLLVRSTWDYHLMPEQWYHWLNHVGSVTHVVNSAPLQVWNTDKTYLLDLAGAGIKTVPTQIIDRESPIEDLCSDKQWTDVVVKPTIGASAYGAVRFTGEALSDRVYRHMTEMPKCRQFLLQPFIGSVATVRERSLVFFDGAFSHAFSKAPFHSEAGDGGFVRHEASAEELSFGESVIQALPARPVFARIDIVSDSGGPLVMEAELIEPALGLRFEPSAADRFATSVIHQIRGLR